MASSHPSTLGGLRRAVAAGLPQHASVKDEVRANLIARLRAGGTIFPGLVGYADTVVPQVVNALLSKHNFILLGLRGQAKTRMLRALVGLLDESIRRRRRLRAARQPVQPVVRGLQGEGGHGRRRPADPVAAA